MKVRNPKSKKNGKKTQLLALNKSKRIYYDLSLGILDELLILFFSENDNINRKIIKRLNEFLSKIDFDAYDDEERALRLFIIRKLTKGVLKKGLNEVDRIIDDLSENKNFDKIVDILEENRNMELSDSDLERINQYLADRIEYAYIYQNNASLLSIATEFESRTFESLPTVVEEYYKIIEHLHSTHKKNKLKSQYEEQDFSFKKIDELESAVEETIKIAKSPKGTIKTGIQVLNKYLGGGFKAKNLYVFFAVPGRWKSGLLLNCCIWALKYNKELEPKDKTKVPTILYLSLENDVEETIERLYSYIKGNDAELKDTTKEEVLRLFKKKFVKNTNIDLEIKYRPSNTISADDIEEMIEQLSENENKEVVMVAVDYTRRMKATDPFLVDEHLKLGCITDDLSILSKKYTFPVLSAAQLNREAERVLDQGDLSGKTDLGKKLGRSMLSDSRRILENIDRALLINLEEMKSSSRMYLTFKDGKSRKKNHKISYFAVPFRQNNGMRLVEDINKDKPCHIFKMADDLNDFSQGKKVKTKTKDINPEEQNEKQLDDLFDE